MSEAARKWGDLKARVLTGITMAVVGGAAIWFGGWWFLALLVLMTTLMLWELGRMVTPDARFTNLMLADLGGLGLLGFAWAQELPWWVFLAATPILGLIFLAPRRLTYFAYATVIMGSGAAMYTIRQDLGLSWMLWLVLVVVVTDIAGYFVGRIVGGPKFWPRISPKKTWSGTAGGWVGAAIVGYAMQDALGLGQILILVSVFLSFASQLGDIAESAIKRSVLVKDSSNLLPGHGGVLDRFDGMVGAAFVLWVILLAAPGLFGFA